ncbi:MAG: hypothetical protein H0V46_08965 [Sphingomonas sp.]|nr:hypothetical protein [Sphingomonas sp.]
MIVCNAVPTCDFDIRTLPRPDELGWAIDRRATGLQAFVEFHFGDSIAVLPVSDVWHVVCELALQAQLVREKSLRRFLIDVQQLFAVDYDADVLVCTWPAEQVFAVSLDVFASALERLVEDLIAHTRHPKLTRIRVDGAVAMIRAQPYLSQFSDEALAPSL